MRVVLHIGQPKTGTSAIQISLSQEYKALLAEGVLYPIPNYRKTMHAAHRELATAICTPRTIPRDWRKLYENDPAKLETDFAKYTARISAEIGKHKPQVVILSGESLFRPLVENKGAVLHNWLRTISDDITVVAYVRGPESFYLSAVYQRLRASSVVTMPQPVSYRSVLESYKQEFGKVEVVRYDDGAVQKAFVSEFLRQFVPELRADFLLQIGRERNRSLSAETMALLQDYRRTAWPDQDEVFNEETDQFISLIRAISARHSLDRKANLHASVARYIESVSVDVLWLRSECGIEFPNCDYDAVGQVKPRIFPRDIRVSDICAVDEEIRDRIAMLAMDELLKRKP